jgi:hypothetical protein
VNADAHQLRRCLHELDVASRSLCKGAAGLAQTQQELAAALKEVADVRLWHSAIEGELLAITDTLDSAAANAAANAQQE